MHPRDCSASHRRQLFPAISRSAARILRDVIQICAPVLAVILDQPRAPRRLHRAQPIPQRIALTTAIGATHNAVTSRVRPAFHRCTSSPGAVDRQRCQPPSDIALLSFVSTRRPPSSPTPSQTSGSRYRTLASALASPAIKSAGHIEQIHPYVSCAAVTTPRVDALMPSSPTPLLRGVQASHR